MAVGHRHIKLAGCLPNCIQLLLEHYEYDNACSKTLKVLSSSTGPPVAPYDTHDAEATDEPSTTVRWLKIGSHPLWWKTIPRWVNMLLMPHDIACVVKVAWRNVVPNLAQRISVHNSFELSGR